MKIQNSLLSAAAALLVNTPLVKSLSDPIMSTDKIKKWVGPSAHSHGNDLINLKCYSTKMTKFIFDELSCYIVSCYIML
jgi:hypothetical protein